VRHTALATLCVLGVVIAAPTAQDLRNLPEEHFDAIAIRPNVTETRPSGGMQPNGRLNIRATTVVQLLTFAYNGLINPERFVGLPQWASRERFDIIATADRQTADDRALLRGLLRDRFSLRSSVEQREVSIYVMTAHPEGKLGPGLRRAAIDCADAAAADRARAQQKPGEPRPCGGYTRAAEVSMGGATMNALATMLSTQLGRPVLNRTGLEGRFDMSMTWAPSLTATTPTAGDDQQAGLFTAVQEQLGLRLRSDRASVDVLVIDQIERPTEN
jgi:uncharacterized protein (TIGR03435 family)